MPELPLLDLSSGYVQRAVGLFPKQGAKSPWRFTQNYVLERAGLALASLDDTALTYAGRPAARRMRKAA
jgi:hypothetical protein